MIAPDSPLRRLPAKLERKQALFFDGIRHAAELADYAYGRLVESLTTLALAQHRGETQRSYTAPFLYAWAVVDSVDRLRGLLHLAPGVTATPHSDGQPSFRERTQVIRDLRNVADHVAERVDYIVAQNSTALGVLSWFTVLDEQRGLACTIMPGTSATGTAPLPNPVGKVMIPPTDLITLKVGEYTGSLSDAMGEMRRVVSSLEASLGSWLCEHGFEGKQAGADVLVVALMEFGD